MSIIPKYNPSQSTSKVCFILCALHVKYAKNVTDQSNANIQVEDVPICVHSCGFIEKSPKTRLDKNRRLEISVHLTTDNKAFIKPYTITINDCTNHA